MSRGKILIVEDHVITRRGLQRKLSAEGREIICLASASEVTRAVCRSVPDVMILDLMLLDEDPFNSVQDGFAALAWLRRSFPKVKFPVIVYTVDDSPTVDARAEELGAFRVVRKTADISELAAAVDAALKLRRAA